MFIEWSREILLERWVRDPDKCCQVAGVQVPISVQSSKTIYLNEMQQTHNNEKDAQLKNTCLTIVSYKMNGNGIFYFLSYRQYNLNYYGCNSNV